MHGQSSSEPLKYVKCRYSSTFYCNYDRSFMIAQYTACTDNPDLPDEVVSDGYTFIAKGGMLPDKHKLDIVLNGVWRRDKRYKNQYLQVQLAEIETPMNHAGIVHYLSCGLIRGIGEATAEKIYNCFGSRSLEILEREPEKLLHVKGIGREKLERIVASYKEANALKSLIRFLAPYRVSMTAVVNIYRELGDNAAELLKEDPFVLDNVGEFDFPGIDIIARKSGTPMDSYLRMKSAARYVLTENNHQGHLYMKKAAFLQGVTALLTGGVSREVLGVDRIKTGLNRMVTENILCYGKGLIYLYSDFEHEDGAARDVVRLLGCKTPQVEPLVLEVLIAESEKHFEVTLSANQKEAIRQTFCNPLFILTGGPGTGKTSAIRFIIYIQQRLTGSTERIVTVAPTGRAASNMSESTGLQAKTLHKALRIFPAVESADEGLSRVHNAAMVIVDETSMVDMHVFYELTRNIRNGTRVILLGDVDQLPSVGAGNVLKELLDCKRIPFTVLDVTHRQDETSRIVTNTVKIRGGDTKLDTGADFVILPAKTEKEANEVILSIYAQLSMEIGAHNVQVLSPRRKDCICCSDALNKEIQAEFNPYRRDRPQFQVGGRTLRTGDKVIQTRNTDDISNGDTGYVNYVHLTGDQATTTLDVQFDAYSSPFSYDAEACADLDLAYCLSVHKAQGAEYPAIIVPILSAHKSMLRRNILYTAVSRARELVFIVGSEEAIAQAIRRNDVGKRNTKLAERIALYTLESALTA